MSRRYAAVDLGASSGRVVVGTFDQGRVSLDEVHRFPNGPVLTPEGYRWDILGLWRDILVGLRRANDAGPLLSIGIDSWAIDYGLFDRDGRLLGNPWHHRDPRTDGVAESFFDRIPADDLYRINGLQHLPFTTIYQLLASQPTAQFELAERMLLIPDLLVYWLTGVAGTERTNASTTGLLDATTGDWSPAVLDAARLRPSLLAPLRAPGEVVGNVLPAIRHETGLNPEVLVTAVGSHDTASAVVAVPTETTNFAYVACGTWSLVGVELDEPVLTVESRAANFTNEGGVDGTVRYLRNVMGLWLLSTSRCARGVGKVGSRTCPPFSPRRQRCRRVDRSSTSTTRSSCRPATCRRGSPPVSRVGPADPAVQTGDGPLHPGQPRGGVRPHRHGRRTHSPVATVDVVHLVGGGSQNALLCQLTADAAGCRC